MTRQLHSKLYKCLLTSALEAEINARKAKGWRVDVTSADSSVRPELPARHACNLLRRALEGIPEGDGAQSATQVALANRLVEVLDEHGAMAQICAPSDSAQYAETEISGQEWASSSLV